MGVATFDYQVWSARYPALAARVDASLADAYFAEAGIYLDNTDSSIVENVAERGVLLNMLVAHIASLNGGSAASEAGLVGRIASVTEGSVTISAEYAVGSGTEKWYSQTPYGAQYWAATAKYRSATYIPGPQPFLGVPGTSGWGAGRWSN